MKNSRPYFSPSIVDRIVSVINEELTRGNKAVSETALRTYIQSGKSIYENAVLSGVAEGVYLATVQESGLAYKVKPPTEKEVDEVLDMAKATAKVPEAIPTPRQVELAMKNARAAKLSHALNMVALYGSRAKLVDAVTELVTQG